jgi:indole-3-glycerol phosphate synthase
VTGHTISADLLETIVAATRRAVDVRRRLTPQAQLESQLTRKPAGRAFIEALRASPAPRIIAECKRRSPSRGILRASYDPAAHASAYANAGAAAISVLTEPTFFDGTLDHLAQVRSAVNLPLLRKDFIVTEYQLVESAMFGADAVLLIVGALDDKSRPDRLRGGSGESRRSASRAQAEGLRYGHASLRTLLEQTSALGLAALVEVHDRVELGRAVEAGATVIGVNSRNLRTLTVDRAVLEHLIAEMPTGVTAVAESGIRTTADLERLATLGYHAFLVGERLITESDPGAALAELRGA